MFLTVWMTVSIGSGNGLVPNQQQAIISANVDHNVIWCHYALVSSSYLVQIIIPNPVGLVHVNHHSWTSEVLLSLH